MKILMVNKFLYTRGGAETYFLKLGKQLEKLDNKVEYFGMYDKKNTVGNSCKQYTTNMDFHTKGLNKIFYPFKIIYSFEAKRKIRKVIKNFKPDVVHLNNINFQLTPAIIDEISKYHIPIVQTVHDYQMICPNHMLYNLKTNSICEKCLENSKIKCIKYNCIHSSKIKSIIGYVEAKLYKILGTYKKVNLYICPSKFIEEKLCTNKIYQNKTKVIHNFIDIEDDATEKIEKQDYVLYFGRLSEEKGIDLFIEACKELENIQFVIAGSGPMEEKCKNIKNVNFVGFKNGKELKELIQKALFTVYPSIWYENCPLSVLESESLGTPVLSTKLGGTQELIEHEKTGILMNEISKEQLIENIKKLYINKELLKYMSNNCVDKRKRMIKLTDYCEEIMKIYAKLIEKERK